VPHTIDDVTVTPLEDGEEENRAGSALGRIIPLIFGQERRREASVVDVEGQHALKREIDEVWS
jgi:hypothetical protein